MRTLALPLLLLAALSTTACGLLFVEGPPQFIPDDAISVRCTDSMVLPNLDGVWMGLNALVVVDAIGDDTYVNRDELIAGGVVWIVFSGISALVGQRKVKACREAKDMVAARAPTP